MSKSLTLADLEEALAPIIRTLTKLREEQNANSSQISEIHQLVSSTNTKIDTLDQTAGAAFEEVTKVTKKPAARKPAAKRPAAKKPAQKAPVKKPAKKSDDDPDAESTEPADTKETEDVMDDLDDSASAGANDRPNDSDAAEVAADNESDVDADEDEDDAADSKKKSPAKKPPAKKAAVAKKPPAKKAAVAKKPAAAPRSNIMTIFKNEFKTNPERFDEYLTDKVKKQIVQATDNWDDMSDADQCNEYYKYMKANHEEVLQMLKEELQTQ